MVLRLITVNFANTSILFHHFFFYMEGYFMLNIQDLHVPVLCDIKYIICIYSVKKKKRRSRRLFSVYFDFNIMGKIRFTCI